MKLKMYEKDLDLILLLQMKELIDGVVKESKKRSNQRKLFIGRPSISMGEQYGLCYPGEVLERYTEQCGGGIEQMRALALALAEKKELLEKEMFIGKQYSNFLGQIRQHEGQDIYLSCALYLLLEREEEIENLYQKILSYNYKSTEEALLAAYVLRNRPDAWQWNQKILDRFFGKERTIRVYGNEQAYKWLIKSFYEENKDKKDRDGRLIRGFLLFVSKNIKKGNSEWKMFRENGYTEQEIRYMNLYLSRNICDTRIPELGTITKRRMAFSYCEDILNAEKIESSSLLEMCEDLFTNYKNYDGKLNGKSGIFESLEDVVIVKNLEVFRFLYPMSRANSKMANWLKVNLNDDRWNDLAEWMKTEEYQKLYGQSIIKYGKDEIEIWLDRYFRLKEEHYMNVFWKNYDYTIADIMRFFVENNKFDLVAILNQYIEEEKVKTKEELNEKWYYMLKNIDEVIKIISCHEIFSFYDSFDKYYGINDRKLFFKYYRRHPILQQTIDYDYYGLSRIDLKKDILSEDERRVLFNWIEQLVYEEEPKRYKNFLYGCLMNKEFRDLFPEESQKIFAMIVDTLEDGSSEKYLLLQEVYSEEEWKRYKESENLRIEEEKRRKRMMALERYRGMLYQQLEITTVPKDRFMILVERYPNRYSSEDEHEIWSTVFQEIKGEKLWQVNMGDAVEFMDRLLDSLRLNVITWSTALELLNSIEPETVVDTEEKDEY